MTRPTAAPAAFPLPGHRTVAQVDADARRGRARLAEDVAQLFWATAQVSNSRFHEERF